MEPLLSLGQEIRGCLPFVAEATVFRPSTFRHEPNFLFALILAGPKTRTVPVAVFTFLSYEQIDWGGLAAAATIITLPVLLLVALIHRQIARGLTFGGVKG